MYSDYRKGHQFAKMTNKLIKKGRLGIAATIAVTFSLFVAGIRVPDISRPHRPKPSQRAVLEDQVKTSPHFVKNFDDITTEATLVFLHVAVSIPLESFIVLHPPLSRHIFPGLSRAPPLFSA